MDNGQLPTWVFQMGPVAGISAFAIFFMYKLMCEMMRVLREDLRENRQSSKELSVAITDLKDAIHESSKDVSSMIIKEIGTCPARVDYKGRSTT